MSSEVPRMLETPEIVFLGIYTEGAKVPQHGRHGIYIDTNFCSVTELKPLRVQNLLQIVTQTGHGTMGFKVFPAGY